MTARLLARNCEVLAPLYGPDPLELSCVRLRSVHLDWRGPTVTLRLDLPAPSLPLPEEWVAAGVDTVQGQLQFLAVEDLELEGWKPGCSCPSSWRCSVGAATGSMSRCRAAGSPSSFASPAVAMSSSVTSAGFGWVRKVRTGSLLRFRATGVTVSRTRDFRAAGRR
ncbi:MULTISPECIES: Imm50 family immunity protein [unclassified Streptomyces]|uniref:Imm50 family immunity protein n=1 Tax=unclassified Streptomyces TaxID=2593676 RepID=UPI00386A2662